MLRPHIPDGAKRIAGPIRQVLLNKTVTATLEAAVSPEGRGGLRGRYRDEVMTHLDEMRELRASGTPMEATVFWDFENMDIYRKYQVDPCAMMDRVLQWISGVVDAPVTSVEAVEFTRYASTPQFEYSSGKRNWMMTLRQMGGIVHRAWPKMTDHADVILLDRIRVFLDKIKNGGPNRILVMLSGDKGFIPMLEAAQSEGITVIVLTGRGEAHYFPAKCDFSVPIQFPGWTSIKKDLTSKTLDPLRPDDEWTLEQGPRKWTPGVVALQPAPEEELDRRRFHEFLGPELFSPEPARFNGQWVRPGLRLNDTLAAALERALGRTGMEGTRRGRLPPEAWRATERDLADISLGLEEDNAAVFWNFETMRLSTMGPTQLELLARIVRWFQGFLGMPVQRIEVSRYVEPWERLGAYAHDWLYNMDKLGMAIHRVWPPRAEMTNMVLTRSIGALAKVVAARRGTDEETEDADSRLPRLICIVSQDLFFDDQMRAAQKAGVSALWIGPEERGLYYPARSDFTVRIDILAWDTIMEELAMSLRNPFVPGAPTPDAPAAVYGKPLVPADPKWGRPREIKLNATKLEIPKELLQSKIGIGA